MLSTTPSMSSTRRLSPGAKGLSSAIDSEASRSPRMVCTASAIAMPPTPRPATSAVMLTPRLSRAISAATEKMTRRVTNSTMPSEPRAVMSPAAIARCCWRSRPKRTALTPQIATWVQATSTITTSKARSIGAGSASWRSARYRATIQRNRRLVRVISSSSRSTPPGASTPSKRTRCDSTKRRESGSTVKVNRNTASAQAQVRTAFPK